jgi:hypothetical protein
VSNPKVSSGFKVLKSGAKSSLALEKSDNKARRAAGVKGALTREPTRTKEPALVRMF